MTEAKLLLLLLVANGGPILARYFLGERFSLAVDFGRTTPSGQPWLGRSKTYRGLFSSLLAATLCAPLLGFSWSFGLIVGALAMSGDLLASFGKRRIGMPPSSRAMGLDQIPESLFPLLFCSWALDLSWQSVAMTLALFWISEILLSRLLFRWGIRQQPY
jgi:CDP-2,3-bis-(O-geranylgeranyl)-sn-glycerol synthase